MQPAAGMPGGDGVTAATRWIELGSAIAAAAGVGVAGVRWLVLGRFRLSVHDEVATAIAPLARSVDTLRTELQETREELAQLKGTVQAVLRRGGRDA